MKGFMIRYGWLYIPGLLFLGLTAYCQTLLPLYLGRTVDLLNSTENLSEPTKILIQLLYMLLAAAATFGGRFLWRYLIVGNSRYLEIWLRKNLFDHLLVLPPSFYQQQKTGNLMAYAINDIGAIRQTFGPGIGMGANAIVTSYLAISSMSGRIHPRLTILALLPVPLILIFLLILGRQIQHRFRKVQEAFSAISDRISESISGMMVIKAYSQEDDEVTRFNTLNQQSRDRQMNMTRASAAAAPLVTLLFGASFSIGLIYGSRLVLDGTISLGDFVAFFGYLALIIRPVQSVARIVNVLQRGMASWKRYQGILKEIPDIRDQEDTIPEGRLPEKSTGCISIRGLNFNYPGSSRPVLQDIELELKPGQSIGIFGRTGSGKTTLANLLVRLHEAPAGSILLDGFPINQVPINWLRRQISTAPQDNFLFGASISENIRFFDPDPTDAEVEEAAQIADLRDVIVNFPKGLQTVIGERGVTLSGGQKQRVSLARALLKTAPVLVLDDTLSAVDTETERRILENLKKTAASRACLIIANRISAFQDCSEILVMENGKISERGTHNELIANGGFYAEIAARQSGQAGE